MNIIRYPLAESRTRYWNTDWILRVDTSTDQDGLVAEILTAIPPGPMTRLSAIEVARPFHRFVLRNDEARKFIEAYNDAICPLVKSDLSVHSHD